jgi:hypothetical protein
LGILACFLQKSVAAFSGGPFLKSILIVFTLIFFTANSFTAPSENHQGTPGVTRRPVTEQKDSIWNLWGIKERVWGAYDDTLTWDVDVVFGKKTTDHFAKAVLSFLKSPAGRRFVFRNKEMFLKNKLEETGNFEDAFWQAFDEWLKENYYKEGLQKNFAIAVNLLPSQPQLSIHLYYPQSTLRSAIMRGVDYIQFLLADEIARDLPGGNLAPGIIANGIRRASRGGAILASVQKSYNQSRNALTQRIIDLIGVLTKKLVQQGIAKEKLDLKADVTVSAWEQTENFKKNPTFPIRSYFYAANAKNAMVPYQVTQFLDSLDAYRFEEDLNRLGNR